MPPLRFPHSASPGTHPLRRLLRPAGALLLAAMLLLAHRLGMLGAGRAGHEPARIYALGLLAFLLGSTGLALLIHGPRLLDPVRVPGRHPSAHRDPRRS